MKVYISADIEGCTGLVSWSQCSRPDGQSFDYPFARRMMTQDVNAAVRGARAAGATTIVVKDSHGNSKNLLVDMLDAGVELISGEGSGIDGMMTGIDATFNAAILVGYHAMAGTLGGVMEHTITGGIHRLLVNGVETGELGLSMATAGRYGVPVMAVVSDEAGCKEAAGIIPNLTTVSTKAGIGRYKARCKSPETTSRDIENGVRNALQLKGADPFVHQEEVEISIEFNRSEEADLSELWPGFKRKDGYSLEGKFPDFNTAHKAIWGLVYLSAMGIKSIG